MPQPARPFPFPALVATRLTQLRYLHTEPRQSVGTYYAASAIVTIAHEAVHQRGIADEGLTDCTALPLVAGLAVKYFGITETATERYLVPKTIKRTVTVRTTVQAARTVPNPWFQQLKVDTVGWYKAKPRSTRATAEPTDVVAGERPYVAAHLGARPATRNHPTGSG